MRRFRIGALHIADLVQFVDLSRDYLGWYGDLEEHLGYTPGKFPNTLSGWFELIHPDDRDRVRAEYDQFLADSAEGWEFRYRIRAMDGTYRHLLDRGSFQSYVDGVPTEGIGGIIDETEQVVARQGLEDALAEVAALKNRLQAESHYLQSEIASRSGF